MSQKHSEQYKIIGQAIKKYRKQRGLTQEQLADRVSISISYLTKIEAPNCDQPFSFASYGKTGQLLRVSGAAVPFRTVRSTAMLARSATGEVNTVIYLYPAC